MLFISYNSKDEEHARKLKDLFVRQGYRDEQVFLYGDETSGIPPGSRWEKVLYERLKNCHAVIILHSQSWKASQWCFAELAYAKLSGKEVFPVIIDDANLGDAASEHQAVFVTKEGDRAYDRLFKTLSANQLGPTDGLPWPNPDLESDDGGIDDCPFPGLLSFNEHYAAVYYGREQERQAVLEQLNEMRRKGEPRLLMIVGGSGSGKSSLLKAGVLPRLRHPAAAASWLVLPTLRYGALARGDDAFAEQLALNLCTLYPASTGSKPEWTSLARRFSDADASRAATEFWTEAQNLTMARGHPEATVLLPLDQFEELLSPAAGEMGNRFLGFLQAICLRPNPRMLAIGTMRSDYLDVYERHASALKAPLFRPWRLEPFPRERLDSVIRAPAARAGVQVSDELLEKLKADTPTADALPLLAFTLRNLFKKSASGEHLTLAGYARLGGMEGSIRLAAEKAMPPGSLSAETATAVRLSFVQHLAQVNEKGEFVRSTASWSNLPKDAHPVLERFVDERLLVKFEHDGEVWVEVAHEAMFRSWETLRSWLRASSDVLRWRRDVRRDRAADPKWSGLRPAQLAVARDWPSRRGSELTAEEKQWIRRGILRERQQRGAIAAAVVILLCAAAAALTSQQQAQASELLTQEARVRAAQQREIAQAVQLTFDANSLWNGPKRLSMLAMQLASEAHRRLPGSESARVLLAGIKLFPEVVATRAYEANAPTELAFAPGGLLLAGGGKVVRCIDPSTGKELRTATVTGPLRSLKVNQPGTYLAVISGELRGKNPPRTLEILALPGLELVRKLELSNYLHDIQFAGSDGLIISDGAGVKRLNLTLTAGDVTIPLTVADGKVAFSKDGEQAAVVYPTTIKIFSTSTGRELRTIVLGLEVGKDVESVLFDPAGKLLLGVSQHRFSVWNLRSPRASVRAWKERPNSIVMAWSEDSTLIARITQYFELIVLNAQDGQLLAERSTETELLNGENSYGIIFLSADELLAWDGSTAGSIFRLVPQNTAGEPNGNPGNYALLEASRMVLGGHILSFAVSDDKKTLAAVSGAGDLAIWRRPERPPKLEGTALFGTTGAHLQVKRQDVLSILSINGALDRPDRTERQLQPSSFSDFGVFSQDDRQFAACDSSGQVRVFSVESGTELAKVPIPKSKSCELQFLPGTPVLLMAFDGHVKRLDIKTGTLEDLFQFRPRRNVRFSPRGRYLATRDDSPDDNRGGPIDVYDVGTRARKWELPADSAGSKIVFSEDDEFIASPVNDDEAIGVWRTSTGERIHTFEGSGIQSGFAFSPDGRWFGVTNERDIFIWSLPDGTLLFRRSRTTGALRAVAFAPDGSAVATQTEVLGPIGPLGVSVWTLPEGKLLIDQPFMNHVYGIQFSPSGRELLVHQTQKEGPAPGPVTTWLSWRHLDLISKASRRVSYTLTAEDRERYLPQESAP